MKRFTSDDRNEEGRELIPARGHGEATTVDPSFDDEVGEPTNGAMSRRQALGLLGGTLASAALISTVPGVAREAITAPALPMRPWSIEGSGSLVVAQVDAVRLHAFMIGLNDQIWHNEQSGTAFGSFWSGWNFLSKAGDKAKTPACTP
jgi:hypothetical protein